MTDTFDDNGLQVSTNEELLTQLVSDFQNIYGSDINLDQSTPDGQMLNIYAQGGTDIRELLTQIYNSFDPDNCSGRILDARCAINNVFRKGATYTIVPIDITASKTVTLQGLDDNYNNVEASSYTVQDNAGNQFYLISTQTLTTGTTTVLFRAKELGSVQVSLNTITTPVTVVLGVTSVNNSLAPTELGVDEESDYDLKIRRRQSVSIGASGYLNGLLSSVLQLDGVSDAALYENYTNSTDADGIPAHCMWLVVEGGSSSDIADAIYRKKSYGCDMKGSITYTITTVSNQQFIAKWDNPTLIPLYVKFTIIPKQSGTQFNTSDIEDYIISHLKFNIGDGADTSTATTLSQEAIDVNGGGGYATQVLISTGGSSSVTVSGTGITAATVVDSTFQSAVSDTAGTYSFSYNGSNWLLGGNVVDLDDYGITTTGTATNGDGISVVWTASTWVEYISPTTASKLVPTSVTINIGSP